MLLVNRAQNNILTADGRADGPHKISARLSFLLIAHVQNIKNNRIMI